MPICRLFGVTGLQNIINVSPHFVAFIIYNIIITTATTWLLGIIYTVNYTIRSGTDCNYMAVLAINSRLKSNASVAVCEIVLVP